MDEDADNTELWLTWNDHAQILKNVLSTLRYRELYADVTLVCGAKQYAVHRFILSTCSAYFEKLLETIPGHHPVVVLTNTSPKDLEALLDFMYLGQTEVNSVDLDRLLDIAYEFRIRGLISGRDDPENQEPETVLEGKQETEEVEMTSSQENNDLTSIQENNDLTSIQENNDLTVVDTYVMPDSDPLNTGTMMESQEEETELTQNGPEETETEEIYPVKVEEDTKPPPAVDRGLKEYQNFIQRMMEETEQAESLEVTPLVNVPDKPCPTVKKISKHHDVKSKKSKPKTGKIEKFKIDAKKQKEKLVKSKTENSKEKAKPVKNVDDNKTKIMMCPGCKKTFMSQSVLEAHMKTHDDLEIVSCTKCPFKALSQQQMQKHMLTHQQRIEQKTRPFRCPYCPARQTDKSSFVRHQKTLHPDKEVIDTTVMNAKVVLEDCKFKRVRPNKMLKDYVRS